MGIAPDDLVAVAMEYCASNFTGSKDICMVTGSRTPVNSTDTYSYPEANQANSRGQTQY